MAAAIVQSLESGDVIDVSNVTFGDVITAAALVVTGLILARVIRRQLGRHLREGLGLPEGTVSLLTKVSSWTIVVVSVGFALPYLGAQVIPVTLLLILVGLILVVSGRALIENYGAGVVLQAEANFDVGDQIRTSEHEGRVVEVSSRVVLIESDDGRRIVIPNTAVLAGPVEILTAKETRRSEMVVGLAHGTDLAFASRVLRDAVRSVPEIAEDPPADVFVEGFSESGVIFLVKFWHHSDLQSQTAVTDRAALAVDAACRENGLEIAVPQRTLWWGEEPRDPEAG